MEDNVLHINWDAFHFLRPELLWLFVPLIIASLIVMFGIKEEVKWAKTIAPHLRPYVIQKGSERFKKIMQVLLLISMGIGILGVAGPTWKKYELPDKKLESPLIIALDLSQSMMATDIQPTRLERAKFKISDLLAANPKSRIALIGYAGTAHTIIPLTNDYKIVESHISTLKPSIMPFQGSDLDAALKLTDSIKRVTTAPATLLLITDDLTENNFQQLQNFANQGNVTVHIMPMNTPSGSEIPDPRYRNRTIKDASGNPVISSLNTVVLDKLKSIENINITALTLDKTDMQILATDIASKVEFNEEQEDTDQDWDDKGMLLAIPFAILVLYWFRKGWVLFSILAIMTLNVGCQSEETPKIDKEKTKQEFKDLWYSKDYQGQQAYDEGNYAEAADTYEDPAHKGAAYFKYGDYEAAIGEFKKDTTAQGKYNLGVAYYKNGDYRQAQNAFEEAVELNPDLNGAQDNLNKTTQVLSEMTESNLDEFTEAVDQGKAENIDNTGGEDLSGGGQEATKEDMEKERKEETTETDIIKAEELEELPDDYDPNKQPPMSAQKILLRKIDDDPALFTQKKFKHQVKVKKMKPKNNLTKW